MPPKSENTIPSANELSWGCPKPRHYLTKEKEAEFAELKRLLDKAGYSYSGDIFKQYAIEHTRIYEETKRRIDKVIKEEPEMKNNRIDNTLAYLKLEKQKDQVEALRCDLMLARSCMTHMPDMTVEEIKLLAGFIRDLAIELESQEEKLEDMMREYQGGHKDDKIEMPDFLQVEEDPKAAKKKSNG